jgi:hypothetical protein
MPSRRRWNAVQQSATDNRDHAKLFSSSGERPPAQRYTTQASFRRVAPDWALTTLREPRSQIPPRRRKRVIIFREMRTLVGRIAVVTGGTAGVGRGIASELAHCGARVFVTGRSIHDGARDDSQVTGIRCDHREDEQVSAAFERVAQEAGPIDILVNNVWGGYEQMMEDGVFTWSKPFWEQPLWRWDGMFDAGVRAHY